MTKRRVSAFAGSDLDVVLRAGGIEDLVLCGIATSGVVLSTLRQAADLDYRLTVLRDACADADAEVHRVLTREGLPAPGATSWTSRTGRPGSAARRRSRRERRGGPGGVSDYAGCWTAVFGSPSTAWASASTSLSSIHGMLSALANPSAPANWSVRSR